MYQRSTLVLPKIPKLFHVPSLVKERFSLQETFQFHPPISYENPNLKLIAKTKNVKPPSLLTIILNSLDDVVSKFLDLPLEPSINPRHVLAGNFAPVEELPPTACEVVEGSLPPALNGVYIRNGPNPQFIPRGPYHLFDGDGMLHSVRISGGSAVLCSCYVRTHKFMKEGEMGHPFFPSPFSSFNGGLATAARVCMAVARGVSGHFDPISKGFGTANTSLGFFGGALYALCESDLPYEIEVALDGEIVTLGRRDFGGGGGLRMTAHPQADSAAGGVFAFRCDVFPPFLTFFGIDSEGKKGREIAIRSLKRMPCVHDFALTERFVVFEDVQMEMDPMHAARGRTPLVCDGDKVPRIGVLPRGAADDGGIIWIEAAGVNMLHVTNAWEEDGGGGGGGGRIVILAPNLLSVGSGYHDTKLLHSEFELVTVDIKERKVVSRNVVSAININMEFGVINRAYAGKKNRYMYAAVMSEMPKAAGLVKLDLSIAEVGGGDCTVARREYGSGCYGGEAYFVAREVENPAAEEDDGYLVTYVHDEMKVESWLYVMDAKSPDLHIVAKVRLPGRVPYGFHGLFLHEKDLKLLSD